MKKKIAIIVAATLLVACLALGLASCSPDVNNNEKEINVYVGTSVKNILEADFAGFEVNNLPYDYWLNGETRKRGENIRANYATGDYDYVKTITGYNDQYRYDYIDVSEYYCRNGQLFSNEYRTNNYQENKYNIKPIEYSNGIELEFENRRTCMDIEAAKIGLAMMLSAHENCLRNDDWLEQAPEDGIWTGEAVLYPDVSEQFDSYELMDMGFLEALHNIAWFKYATVPITQEQLKQFLTALTLMDEDCAEIADLIVKSGTLREGQSAYDYLMGAFDVIFADVTKTYADYVIEDLVPKYLSYWDFGDSQSSTLCYYCFREILNWFDTGIYRLVIGEFEEKYNIGICDFSILKFSETGELVGIKLDDRTSVNDEDADIFLDLTFSFTPFTLENIDDKETFYIVPHEDDNDMVTAYVDTVANFANKQLENVKHSDMKTYDSFTNLYTEFIGYNRTPDAPLEDYLIYYYEDDNDQYQHTLVNGDEAMYYNPNGEYYFRSENDEWWAYRKIYSSNDYIWKKVKLDEAPEMYTYDPFKLLASIIYDEKDLGEQYYFANFVWKDNEYEFECDGYKMRLTPDAELFIDDEDGKTIEIWLENSYGSYGTPASHYDKFYEIFRDVPTAVESNAKPGKRTFDTAKYASLEAKSVTYKTVNTWGTESQPYLIDFENNICKQFDDYYIFENGTMYCCYNNWDSYIGDHYIKENSSRKYEDVFVFPVKELEGRTYEDIEYDPFMEEFYFTKDDVKYTFTIASGYINKMTLKEGDTTTTYKFSHYGTTSITLPKYRLTDEDLSAALKKTLEVSSYTATRRFKSGITVVEQFDHKNQLASAKWTNADNETMLNILRAVTEDKVWMYSDASGQWLRAELDFDPATYIDSLSELMSFKSDIESRFPSGEYSFDWNKDKDEYTFKNANFDCVITFNDGYLATLGLGSGADAVLEFSNYNEVTLALPTLGHANEDVWTAFTQAVENSSNAANFHMEFEGIISDMPLTFETDVVKGAKSLTTAYVMTATTPEEYESGNFTRMDMLQMYREWSDNFTTTWTKSATPTTTGQFVLGSWSSAVRTAAPEETHNTDMWFYNFAAPLTAGDLPLDVLFVLSKYDETTGEYIVYGYDATDMHVVEYRVKVQDGFIAEVTISDEALLKSMGLQNESLKVSYSKYNETALDRPQDIK